MAYSDMFLDRKRLLINSETVIDIEFVRKSLEDATGSKIQPEAVRLSGDSKWALVNFCNPININKVEKALSTKDIELVLCHPPVSTKVVVRNLPVDNSINADTLTLYFEDTRSCPTTADVLQVDLRPNRVAIVEFVDPTVIDALVKTQHVVCGHEVVIEPWSPLDDIITETTVAADDGMKPPASPDDSRHNITVAQSSVQEFTSETVPDTEKSQEDATGSKIQPDVAKLNSDSMSALVSSCKAVNVIDALVNTQDVVCGHELVIEPWSPLDDVITETTVAADDGMKPAAPASPVVSLRHPRSHQPPPPPPPKRSVSSMFADGSRHNITVAQGSLQEFTLADVLVNVISCHASDLSKAGAVSASFPPGDQLQKEFATLAVPVEFGTNVVATAATPPLHAKFIYHAAVRPYENRQSLDLMYEIIKKCLRMAIETNMATIAFPAFDCGELGYHPRSVALCIARAQHDTGVKMQIYIVVNEDELVKQFQKLIPQDSVLPSASDIDQPVTHKEKESKSLIKKLIRFKKPKKSSSTEEPAVVKTTAERNQQQEVVKQLPEVNETYEVTNDVVPKLDSKEEHRMKTDAKSHGVTIEIDRQKRTLTISGRQSGVKNYKQKVTKLLADKQWMLNDPKTVRQSDGVVAYLTLIGQMSDTIYPGHWKSCAGVAAAPSETESYRRHPLAPSDRLYDVVSRLVTATWDRAKAGRGRDAQNLTHSRIVVQKVWAIENRTLFRKYFVKKQEMCLQAVKQTNHEFPDVGSLEGQSKVLTCHRDLKTLEDELVSEINEVFLLHGTKKDVVSAVEAHGLDFRMAKDSGMFGRGVYLAESSTKADQYTDEKQNRVGAKEPLYMYVVRTLLGHAYVCTKPVMLVKPPCTFPGCNSDKCTDAGHRGEFFDSVIGTHRSNGERLIFREFIVYDSSQCYPEFLIEYERK